MKITNRHLRKLRYIAPVFCSLAVLSTQLQAGPTVQLNGDELRDGMADSGNLGYVGGNTRIGVSINRDLEGQIDLNQIIMEDDSSATSAEGWFGYKIKDDESRTKGLLGGGVKINHQWVNEDKNAVHKAFGAYDQDVDDRGKVTVGYGQETEDLFWSGNVSKSISDDVVTGDVTKRAYDYGVGAQVGTFLDDTLTRIRGGLDYEFGTEFADNEDRPGKMTVSAGVEQFFHDSPHSISLDVSGNQVSGGNDAKATDFNARVGYRYEFGGDGVYQSDNNATRRRVEIPGSPGRPGRAAIRAIPPTPAVRAQPGRAATAAQPGRPAVPPRYERRAASGAGQQFVKTTMKLENETFFKINSSKLTQSAKRNLDKIIGQVRGHGYLGAIRITGNTCGLGDPAYDQRLSENRANAVRDYLVDKGFNPEHLIARGLGKGSPKYDRKDDDFRNRRVDLEYVTERSVKKAANKTQYRDVLVQEGRPAVPARAGRAATPGRPGRAGHPGRAAIPAIAATPGTPSRFVWKTEVIPSAPVWIKRAIRNTISHNKTISTYTTRNAAVTVTADGANQAPVLTGDSSNTQFDTAVTMNVTGNDVDPEGDTLTITALTNPTNGTASITGNNVTYTPNPGYVGVDSYTYTVSDGNGNTASAIATISVAAATLGLNAVDDTATTPYQTPVTINVSSNDTDPDGGVTCVNSIQSNPTNGFVTISTTGTDIVYTPNNGYVGPDSFVYVACDSSGDTAMATVNITVTAANQAPVLSPNYAAIQGYFPVTIRVLADDTDPDGDTLTIVRTHTGPNNGSATISGDDVIYQANNGYVGADYFYYEVSDGNGNLVSERVDIDVQSSGNTNPVIGAIPDITASATGTTTTDIGGFLSDADGDTVYVAVADALSGSITFNGTVLQYTPKASEVGSGGTDTIYITVSDGQGGIADSVINVNIP